MTKPAVILPFRNPSTQQAAPRSRIVFVINSLGPGGAERVMNSILHMAPRNEWECHLILLDREPEHRTPPDFIQVHRLDCRMGLAASVFQLRRALKSIDPNLVVSFLVRANIAAIMAGRAVGAPVVISERAQLTTHLAERHTGLRRWAASAAPRLVYPLADHVIAVSEGVRSDLVHNFGLARRRIEAIPNPFDLDRIAKDGSAEPELPLPPRFIVSVGRLVNAKGFGDLVEAYALAQPDLPLCILGEGPDRRSLETQISALGLADRIMLPGYVKNPFAVVGRAEFFISASHCEGFPNAMAEAMALGLPVVATDCPSGPAEILDGVETTGTTGIREARYGVLVPVRRPDALAGAIHMMADAQNRQHYARVARRRMEDFRIEVVADRYWQTFASVLDRSSSTAGASQPGQQAGRERA